MPSNSDDDIYRNIARLLEHLLRNLPQPEPGQVVGFTVMTGTGRTSPPRGDPFGQETGDDDGVIDYECVGGREVWSPPGCRQTSNRPSSISHPGRSGS